MFGAGKIAEVVRTYMERDGAYRVVAHCVDADWLEDETFQGLPLVAFDDVERRYPPDRYGMFVAIGYHGLNSARAEHCVAARDKGYRLVTYVSRESWPGPEHLEAGSNCCVLDGATIQPGAVIEDNVHVWSSVTVGHHSRVGENTWVAAGTTLGGSVTIGADCFLGLGATIAHQVTVGRRCFIGSQAIIAADAESEGVYIARSTPRYRLEVDAFLHMANM